MVFGDFPGVERPAGVEVEVGLHRRLAFWWRWCSSAATGVRILGGTVVVPIVIGIRSTNEEAGRRTVNRLTNPVPQITAVSKPEMIELIDRTVRTDATHVGEVGHGLWVYAVDVVDITESRIAYFRCVGFADIET